MKKFEGILICTDLDGTLLQSDRTISRENIEAIEYFKAEGGYFTFVTGRPPVITSELSAMIRPNAPIGCINGGGLYDTVKREYIRYEELPRSVFEILDDVCENISPLGFQVNTVGDIYFCRENETMANFRKITGSPNLVCEHRDISVPMVKIVFGGDRENIAAIAKYLQSHPRAKDFDFIRSEETLFEILPKGVNKGSVMPMLAEHLGISPRRIIAVGDYDNDVGMLKAAGIGIAVANASPAALAASDFVTVSNNEHAIAKIINDVESGKIRL